MDFASLMSAQIAKGKPAPKSKTPEQAKPSKYIKRADVEAQRQAEYAAEQKAIEDARLTRLEKKRKFEEDETEKNRAREEKRKRLAEESRRLREEEEEKEERIRRKRLGLPELPPKEKAPESGDATAAPENDTPDEELVQKLREMNEPARLFGETHTGRLRRYRKLAGLDTTGKPKAVMYPGPIPTTLQPVPEADMKIPAAVPKDPDARSFLYRQLASYFTLVLSEWQVSLSLRDEAVKTSSSGKAAYSAMVQARDSMVPLYRKLERGEVEEGILGPIVEIVRACQERRYVDANDAYLRLSIGKAAWPIGVTMVGIHERSAREKLHANDTDAAHIMSDEITRKFLQSIKRCLSFSQTRWPPTTPLQLMGAFGTLRRDNALYGAADDPAAIAQQMWAGNTNVIRTEQIQQSAYQQHLDQGIEPPALSSDTVRYWSDFNRVFYHPKSIVQLQEYELNSALMPFEKWTTGEDLFDSLDKEHDLLDRDLRPFLEECDQLQAFQMITSADDAWGGFAAKYLERMRDELGKTSAWVWGLEEGGRKPRDKQILQVANVAQSIYQISSQASMYIPLTTLPDVLPSYIHLNGSSKWHTSALQLLAIESITLPTRLRSNYQGRSSFADIETLLSNDGNRRVAQLNMSIKDPAELTDEVDGHATQHDSRMNGFTNGNHSHNDLDTKDLDIDMQPKTANLAGIRGNESRRTHLFSQLQSLRGKWKSSIEIEDANLASRDRFGHGPRIETHQSSLLFPVIDSFPQVFASGNIVQKLAVQANLSTTTSVAQRIRSVERIARSIIGIDEREALCDGLVGICEEYEDGWESGSESDDDS
ncbi:tubulin nucleotide-binding domain-like protein [Aureobasidium subglaciale]|nr:tubulin nucleotide-binding domain-like protein [Aureobasidium subglaciale]